MIIAINSILIFTRSHLDSLHFYTPAIGDVDPTFFYRIQNHGIVAASRSCCICRLMISRSDSICKNWWWWLMFIIIILVFTCASVFVPRMVRSVVCASKRVLLLLSSTLITDSVAFLMLKHDQFFKEKSVSWYSPKIDNTFNAHSHAVFAEYFLLGDIKAENKHDNMLMSYSHLKTRKSTLRHDYKNYEIVNRCKQLTSRNGLTKKRPASFLDAPIINIPTHTHLDPERQSLWDGQVEGSPENDHLISC